MRVEVVPPHHLPFPNHTQTTHSHMSISPMPRLAMLFLALTVTAVPMWVETAEAAETVIEGACRLGAGHL